MTPEREAYLAKCNERERLIRILIKYHKYELKKAKAVCSSYDLKKMGRKPLGYRLHIGMVKQHKVTISALYHELARLKGMDRVTVPKLLTFSFSDGKRFEGIVCSHCGETLMRDSCANCGCGRRILWEEVK